VTGGCGGPGNTELFAGLPEPVVAGSAADRELVSPHFEELRWFELPDACLAE
jgi:hypothetical protein